MRVSDLKRCFLIRKHAKCSEGEHSSQGIEHEIWLTNKFVKFLKKRWKLCLVNKKISVNLYRN